MSILGLKNRINKINPIFIINFIIKIIKVISNIRYNILKLGTCAD